MSISSFLRSVGVDPVLKQEILSFCLFFELKEFSTKVIPNDENFRTFFNMDGNEVQVIVDLNISVIQKIILLDQQVPTDLVIRIHRNFTKITISFMVKEKNVEREILIVDRRFILHFLLCFYISRL